MNARSLVFRKLLHDIVLEDIWPATPWDTHTILIQAVSG
jgi:hypothetical protein